MKPDQLILDAFVRAAIQRCMGKALDYARMSGMSDRSLEQYRKSIKDDFYQVINDSRKMLEMHGYPVSPEPEVNKD